MVPGAWDHPDVRVLVASTAGSGHFGPLLPFARGLLAAGHDVAVAAPQSFAATVTGAGFDHLPFADVPPEVMGAVFDRLSTLPGGEADRVVVREVFGRLDAQAALPGVAATVEAWGPDLVLREPCELGSLAAAEASGVPHATVAIGMDAALVQITSELAEPLQELDALAGLPPGRCATAFAEAPVLTCVPEILDGATGDATRPLHRFRVEEVRATPSLPPAWGDPDAPLVYVTFGSVAGRLDTFTTAYVATVEVLAEVPYRVLLTTGKDLDPAALGTVPDHVRVEPWWPQADLMPATDALVGHGGFGTTMTAVLNGVPQVVVPLFSFDQRLNAQHVAAAGAGVHLEDGIDALADLPATLEGLLANPGARTSAAAVATAAAALPPVTAAVTLLERLAR